MDNITNALAEFAYQLRFDTLPQSVKTAATELTLDYFSACYAGMKVNVGFNSPVAEILCDRGGKEEASVIPGSGITRRLPAESAAFMNAVYAHGADMDDGNRKAMGHIGAHVISAVIALAEAMVSELGRGIPGEELLSAVVVGYEVFCRVAYAAQPGLVRRGFHSTGTAGAIACAAACSRLTSLSREQIYCAMSLAALQSGGLLIVAESGQECKPLNPANAARIGIFSTRLAQRNVSAPLSPLESEKGWLHAMTDSPSPSVITHRLGEEYAICESYVKPYPSCRHTHALIQCAIAIRQRMVQALGDRAVDSVSLITAHIYPNAINVAGSVVIPRCNADTKFSLHYALAYALINGGFDLAALRYDRQNIRLEELISKIKFVPDPTLEDTEGGIRGARVEVLVANGERFCESVSLPKGDASAPLSSLELEEKLEICAFGILTKAQTDALKRNVRALGDVDFTSLNGLFE